MRSSSGQIDVKLQRIPGSGLALKRTVSATGPVMATRKVGDRAATPPPLCSGKADPGADIEELKSYDRGHLVALELGGCNDCRLIAPMIRQLNQSGKWRQMERAILTLLTTSSDAEDDTASSASASAESSSSASASAASSNVAFSLQTANSIDTEGWNIKIDLFYEDTKGDVRVPVWFYVSLYYRQKLRSHFSLGNMCGKRATMPNQEEILEFQAATDIYADLSAAQRGSVVRKKPENFKDLYLNAGDKARPNQILEFMFDVNLHCEEASKEHVFNKMRLETEGGSRPYSDFQREIIRKYNRFKHGGELKSDAAKADPAAGERADRYLVLNECGGRNAPEVDHINPSYQSGGNFYINGRLVSFLHNHLYREKKTSGSQPVSELLWQKFKDGKLAFPKGSEVRSTRASGATPPEIWIECPQGTDGSNPKDFIDNYFNDGVMFDDKRNLQVEQTNPPYRSMNVPDLVLARQTFLQAADERERKYEKEEALEPRYSQTEASHEKGWKKFVDDQDHPERKRLLKLIADAKVKLCEPSDVLKDDGGLVAAGDAPAFVDISPSEAREGTYYKNLLSRWDAVKPQ